MKLRRLPEDFQVTELTTVAPSAGAWTLYRLRKISIGTPEAIAAICRQWNLPRNRISYAGLKDRHAVTEQYLSIRNGPRQSLIRESLQLQYLGQIPRAITAAEITGNHFRIVVRNLVAADADLAVARAQSLIAAGLPNYFDDQRFGSLGFSGEWIAKHWCLKNWERALWLALADLHPDDSAAEKQQKQLLSKHWGQWPECQKLLDRSHRRSIITYLADKVRAGKAPDFRGALARINSDLRGLYLSAFQSALWNRVASGVVAAALPEKQRRMITLQSGPAVFPHKADAAVLQQAEISISLPSARSPVPPGLPGQILHQVLAEEQIPLHLIRITSPRDRFFSRAMRSVIVRPQHLQVSTQADDLYAGRCLLQLEFDLPSGSYATMLVRSLLDSPRLDTETDADSCFC